MIPSFVYKWLKETSGGGYLRSAEQPNRRIQDGHKLYWLCWDCEQRFNNWETQFANQVFHPINRGETAQASYGSWFLLFCVSVSWRVLNFHIFHIEKQHVDHFPEKFQRSMKRAQEAWREFLLNQRPHPGQYEQHFLPLDAIDSYTISGIPPNINRYILRTVDIDAVHGGQTASTYSKLERFIILGFVELPRTRQWIGTQVHVKHGAIKPGEYVMPVQFMDYLIGKAKTAAAAQNKISQRQNAKIEAAFRKNIDRVANSETFRALSHDVRLFGRDAFRKEDKEL